MSRILFASLACLVLFFATTTHAADPVRERPLVLKVRVHVPLTQWTIINGNLFEPSFGGGTLALEILDLIAIEGGGNARISAPHLGTGWDGFVRAGVSPRIFGKPRRGWVLQFDALAGYRFLERAGSGDGHYGKEQTHGFSATVGLQVTGWLSHVGGNFRFFGGPTFPLVRTTSGSWSDGVYFSKSDDLQWALELGIEAGLAFN